ncbi:hypothetical protein LEP1GSC089_1654 [Leptospira interrogans serovar Autumnalis str. LP101]|nr:hypothetical protein LEP1GSC089_1654 [Leptospira interrogans serovar Autumnalis str. LP101]
MGTITNNDFTDGFLKRGNYYNQTLQSNFTVKLYSKTLQ